jgi:hypothetical protein
MGRAMSPALTLKRKTLKPLENKNKMSTQTATQRKAALEAARKAAIEAKNGITPPAMAKKGTQENPFTREEYSLLEEENRMICTHEGARGAWWKAQDGPRFMANGEGIRGRREGSTNEGAGFNSRRLNAARIKLDPQEFKKLLPVKVEDGTPGTEAFLVARAVREEKAATGLSLIQSIMGKVEIELPESQERTIERSRNAQEIQDLLVKECGGDVALFAVKLQAFPQVKEVIPAAKGGKLTISQLAEQGAATVPPGTLSALREYAATALNEAFSVLTA